VAGAEFGSPVRTAIGAVGGEGTDELPRAGTDALVGATEAGSVRATGVDAAEGMRTIGAGSALGGSDCPAICPGAAEGVGRLPCGAPAATAVPGSA